MAKSSSITGNGDGSNGENQSYKINGRGNVSRRQLVNEVKQGAHTGVHIIEVNKTEYVRANPNSKLLDNIDE